MEHESPLLQRLKPLYLRKMNLITWKAAQWMQYQGHEYRKDTDEIVLKFLSSSYGISFEIRDKAFSVIYGEPYLDYDETYNFFKVAKYKEAKRI